MSSIKENRNIELEYEETQLRLQRMSDFLVNLGHEVRTPLTAMLTTCELMQNGLADPMTDEQLIGISVIQKSGSHILELMDEALDLAKIESGSIVLESKEVSVNSLCESSLQ